MAAPIIGITCEFETVTDSRGAPSSRFLLTSTYVDALAAFGAHSRILPHQAEGWAPRALDGLQGLLISGGDADAPPAFYGQTPRPGLRRVCEARSLWERALLREALRRDLPILGVCGGMQILNVVLGGTLHQDLAERPDSSGHEQPHDKRQPHHPVQVRPGSLLAGAYGAQTLQANSTHHQAVDRVGAPLQVSGTTSDGVIEAIELPGKRFVVGVQWHPEALGPGHWDLYRAFVAACQPAVEV